MEEISQGMHASRSTEQTHLPERFTLKHARDIDPSGVLPAASNVSPSVEPVSFVTSLEGHSFMWPSITDSDRARSYTLGKLNLEAQIVVELFQQCVSWLSPLYYFR
jgi:hypothetical protein